MEKGILNILDRNLKKIDINEIRYLIGGWNDDAVTQFGEIYNKYGSPNEYTDNMLIWYNNGDWVKTILYKKQVLHNFPKPHYDIIKQCIYYRVPLHKYDDIADFDGSTWAERTNGYMVAQCGCEAMNYVTINLAHAIITDTLNVEQARKEYGCVFTDVIENKNKPVISQQFSFEPFSPQMARDPDVQTI